MWTCARSETLERSVDKSHGLLLLFMRQHWAVAGRENVPLREKWASTRHHSHQNLNMKCDSVGHCVQLFFEMSTTVIGGLSLLLCRVGVFTARTKGWMEYSTRPIESVARRAVYNNNTGGATSGERQQLQPIRVQSSDQQHAIFGKWLHHRSTTVQYGGRDFRRNCHFVVQKRDNKRTSFIFLKF